MNDINVEGFQIKIGDRIVVPEKITTRFDDSILKSITEAEGFALPGGMATKDLHHPYLSDFLTQVQLVKDTDRYTCRFNNPHNKES